MKHPEHRLGDDWGIDLSASSSCKRLKILLANLHVDVGYGFDLLSQVTSIHLISIACASFDVFVGGVC